MNGDTWRVNEIKAVVEKAMDPDNVNEVNAFFSLGRIYTILTMSDPEIQALNAFDPVG